MENGIYRVMIDSPIDRGIPGVVIIKDGKIIGCDERSTYTGTVENGLSGIKGYITITRNGGIPSTVSLKLSGIHVDSRFDLEGLADGWGNVRYTVQGSRMGDIA